MYLAKVLSASTLWLLAVVLMTTASIDEAPMLRGWAGICAVAATMPTMWLIFDYNRNRLRDEMMTVLALERDRTERLIFAVAHEFARAEVTNLESRRSV